MPRHLVLLVLLGASVAAANTFVPLGAAWRTAELVMDGNDGEWTALAAPLGAAPVAISLANDGDHLYVRVRTSDRAAMTQIVRGGFVVWFDPKGGDKKTFGIKYPVGTPLSEDDFPGRGGRRAGAPPRDPTDERAGDEGTPRRPLPPAPGDPEGDERRPPTPMFAADPSLVPPRLELLGRDKNAHRTLLVDHTPGIGVAVGRMDDTLVYELRVPLAKSADRPYAVGARPGSTIGLGLETFKLELPAPPQREGAAGRPPMGGMGGRGGGGTGGSQGGLRRPELPKPWQAWARVTLATN